MSEIAKRRKLCTSVQSEPAISEHAQEHAPPFRAAVLDRLLINCVFFVKLISREFIVEL